MNLEVIFVFLRVFVAKNFFFLHKAPPLYISGRSVDFSDL